jgi:hypothetical protein
MMDLQPCVQSCECPGFEDLLAIVLFPVVAHVIPWGSTIWTLISAGALKTVLYGLTVLLILLTVAHPDQCGCRLCGTDSCDPQP